jgi:hypothetical protein
MVESSTETSQYTNRDGAAPSLLHKLNDPKSWLRSGFEYSYVTVLAIVDLKKPFRVR